MCNLKKKFVERTGEKISLNTFLKFKPFFVVYMKCDARDTCACPVHLNMQLKLNKLHELKVIESKNLSQIMADLTCNSARAENCMIGLCSKCQKKQLKTAHYDHETPSFYHKWDRIEEQRVNKKGQKYAFKAMVKRKIADTLGNIVEMVNNEIPAFLDHLNNDFNQHQFYKKVKGVINSTTGALHCDWSESWATKCHTEVQALHFGGSRTLLSIHTNACYMWNPKTKKIDIIKHCTISEDARHTASAIFAHLKPLFQMFKDSGVKTLHIFSDGPTGQYRNKRIFFLICHFAKEYGFDRLIWNYFEKHHGKGAIDGYGATLKITANNKVSQGSDITDAASFINVLKHVKIDLSEIKSDEIDMIEKIVPAPPKELKAAAGTFKVHQVIWNNSDEHNLYLRMRSCLHREDFSACSKCDFEKLLIVQLQFLRKKKFLKIPVQKEQKIQNYQMERKLRICQNNNSHGKQKK